MYICIVHSHILIMYTQCEGQSTTGQVNCGILSGYSQTSLQSLLIQHHSLLTPLHMLGIVSLVSVRNALVATTTWL